MCVCSRGGGLTQILEVVLLCAQDDVTLDGGRPEALLAERAGRVGWRPGRRGRSILPHDQADDVAGREQAVLDYGQAPLGCFRFAAVAGSAEVHSSPVRPDIRGGVLPAVHSTLHA